MRRSVFASAGALAKSATWQLGSYEYKGPVRKGDLLLFRVPGSRGPADISTQPVHAELILKCMAAQPLHTYTLAHTCTHTHTHGDRSTETCLYAWLKKKELCAHCMYNVCLSCSSCFGFGLYGSAAGYGCAVPVINMFVC